MKNIGFKKFMGYCLVTAMIFTILPTNMVKAEEPSGNWQDPGNVATKFAGGDGSSNNQ